MHSSAKKLQRVLSSREIRKTFIDFFINNHGHKFVRSSPVVPFCDPTVSFVNAGMNQVRRKDEPKLLWFYVLFSLLHVY